jgi:uncharacterized protein DUF4145
MQATVALESMQLHIRSGPTQMNFGPLSMRCPSCKQIGTFETLGVDLGFGETEPTPNVASPITVIVGHRRCPNPTCCAHIFIVAKHRNLQASYPPERIEFDTTGVPDPIVASLEEAITCHANQCFIAAAIMVRKTLELLCSAQNATGQNLKDRLRSLGSKVVLPADLLTGLDDLRLLGNDAAHIESQAYTKVSQQELDVAIEFTKEVLKAIYQYAALLARLRALKNS